MEYRRHLDGRSPDPVELRIPTGLLGCPYGIADLVSGKNSNGDIVHAFRSRRWPLSMRMAFASQIRWRVRAALTVGDVGYALDLVKFSCRVFGLSGTRTILRSPFKVGGTGWEKLKLAPWIANSDGSFKMLSRSDRCAVE